MQTSTYWYIVKFQLVHRNMQVSPNYLWKMRKIKYWNSECKISPFSPFSKPICFRLKVLIAFWFQQKFHENNMKIIKWLDLNIKSSRMLQFWKIQFSILCLCFINYLQDCWVLLKCNLTREPIIFFTKSWLQVAVNCCHWALSHTIQYSCYARYQ